MTTALHTTWNSLTGQCLNEQAVARLWYDFEKAGFTSDDLAFVLLWMQRKNRQWSRGLKDGERIGFAFNLRRVAGDLERFASLLAQARAEKRNRVTRTARDVVLEQSGRPKVTRTDTAKPIRDVLRAMRDL